MLFLFTIVLMLVAFVGCGGGNAGSDQVAGNQEGKPADSDKSATPSVDTTPVTLKWYRGTSGLTDQDFEQLVNVPVKKKYPNISIQRITPGEGTNIADLVAAGDIPDIVATWNGGFGNFTQLDLFEDITPLAKKFNVDLGKFDPVVMDAIKILSAKGELYALPIYVNFNANFYNKDVFDKFGVAYPKDGMTWDQVLDLANKLSRTDSGNSYRGLDPETYTRLSMPLSITVVDGKTNKAAVDSPGWRQVFELEKRIYSIPNNTPPKMNNSSADELFMKDKNVAMLATDNILSELAEAQKTGFNWDMVQYPSYPEKPNIYGYVDTHFMAITKTGKHRDQAMQAISVITSDEVQGQLMSSAGQISPLKNPELKKRFGADMPFLKGKNLDAIFKGKLGPGPAFSPYEKDGKKILDKSFVEYANGKDLNTTLREAAEAINKTIADKQGKQ
jgi:multiple sugar transport system substrate-binding protein